MELWKKIENYENYSVSSLGRVRNDKFGRILSPGDNGNGYLKVQLCKNGKTKEFKVHRLVAEAFIDNTENKPQVNHIDGNKSNNEVSNLEWCTASENAIHKFDVLGFKFSEESRLKMSLAHFATPIICLDTGKRYCSISEASKQTGVPSGHIWAVVKEKRKSAGGLHFKYVT